MLIKVQSHGIISCKLTRKLTQGKDILTMAKNKQFLGIKVLRDNSSVAVKHLPAFSGWKTCTCCQ
jgi:hypothetical protein